MARNPSDDEKMLIRSLLAAAGSPADFDAWVASVRSEDRGLAELRRPRGRPRGHKHWEVDRNLIFLADDLLQVRGCTPRTAISEVVNRYWRKDVATSTASLIKRLYSRLAPIRVQVGSEVLEVWPSRYSCFEDLAITKAMASERERRLQKTVRINDLPASILNSL